MQTTTREARAPQQFPPLESLTRPNVPTEQASFYLDRRPNTLRAWSCEAQPGPIKPVRINVRLGWPVSELKRVLGVSP